MGRARRSLEKIVSRMRASGYVFVAEPLRDASPNARGELALFDARFGPFPLSLLAAWEVLGPCNLMGQHPQWPNVACVALPGVQERGVVLRTDPFVLEPYALAMEDLEDQAGAPYAVPRDPVCTDYTLDSKFD